MIHELKILLDVKTVRQRWGIEDRFQVCVSVYVCNIPLHLPSRVRTNPTSLAGVGCIWNARKELTSVTRKQNKQVIISKTNNY